MSKRDTAYTGAAQRQDSFTCGSELIPGHCYTRIHPYPRFKHNNLRPEISLFKPSTLQANGKNDERAFFLALLYSRLPAKAYIHNYKQLHPKSYIQRGESRRLPKGAELITLELESRVIEFGNVAEFG
jgi:hypothetical protein